MSPEGKLIYRRRLLLLACSAIGAIAVIGYAHTHDEPGLAKYLGRGPGIVNLAKVYEDNDRVKRLNREIAKDLADYRKKHLAWSIPSPLSPQFQILPSNDEQRQQLVEMRSYLNRVIDEKHAAAKKVIVDEIHECIKGVAEAYGFNVVLGYGTPELVTTDVFRCLKTNPQREVMSAGVYPLYVDPQADLTDVVIRTLNHRDRPYPRLKKSPEQP